jgi:hypothetical protein
LLGFSEGILKGAADIGFSEGAFIDAAVAGLKGGIVNKGGVVFIGVLKAAGADANLLGDVRSGEVCSGVHNLGVVLGETEKRGDRERSNERLVSHDFKPARCLAVLTHFVPLVFNVFPLGHDLDLDLLLDFQAFKPARCLVLLTHLVPFVFITFPLEHFLDLDLDLERDLDLDFDLERDLDLDLAALLAARERLRLTQ